MSRRVTAGESIAVAGVDELDRADDLRRRGVLEQEAGRAGLQRAQDEFVGVEGREHEDGGRVGLRGEQAGGRDAVELWHADVHEHDVGPVEVHRPEHLAAVVGLGDHLEARCAGEHHPQAGAHERVVVDEQDADHRGRRARRTNAPSGSTPCSSSPPASVTRSARPIEAGPRPGQRRPRRDGHRREAADLDLQGAVGRVDRECHGRPGACLRALVSPSCTIR